MEQCYSLTPDANTYGILIESYCHRGRLVEALQLLEQTSARNIQISEIHMRVIRNRCKNLGLEHPDVTADPNAWVKRVKQVQKNKRHSSQSKIQELRSTDYA